MPMIEEKAPRSGEGANTKGSRRLPAGTRAAWEALVASPYARLALKTGPAFYAMLAERVSPPENAWVLDVGCGGGVLDVSLAERFPAAYFTGVDESNALIRQANHLGEKRLAANCSFVSANPMRLPFTEAFFDVALSVSSLCYWRDPKRCLHEMRRVLVSDGLVCVAELDIDHTEQEIAALVAAIRKSALSFMVLPSGRHTRRALLEQGVSRLEAAELARSASLREVTTERIGGGLPIFVLKARK